MEKRVVKNSVIMICLYAITKIAGFAKEMLMANYYGASMITDAYNVVVTMSSTFFEGITTAIVVGYLVIVTKENDEEKVNGITSRVISVFATAVFIISLIATVFAKQTCSILAVGFDKETMDLTVHMARLILPFSALFVAKNVIGGYLQSKNIFWFTGAGNFIMNMVLILSIIISFGNTNVLALGYSAATVMVWLVGWIAARHQSFRFRYAIKWDDALKQTVKLAVPVFITQTIVELNLIIDRNFASVLGSGMVSMFNYANKVYVLFVAVFAQAFATAIFPDLSSIGAKSEEKFRHMVKQALEMIALVMVPVALFVTVKAQDIVEIVFLRGAFGQSDADITARILCIYALAIPAVALTEMLNKCFYAVSKAKEPMWAGVAALVMNVVGNFAFIWLWGYIGLAVSTVISTWGLVLILMTGLIKNIKKFEMGSLIKNILRILASSVIGCGVVWLMDRNITLSGGNILGKIALVAVEFLVLVVLYLVTAYLFRLSYVKDFIKIGKKLLNRVKIKKEKE